MGMLICLILIKLVLHSCTTIQRLLILNSAKILLSLIDFPYVFFVTRMEPDKSCSQEEPGRYVSVYEVFSIKKISRSITLRDF